MKSDLNIQIFSVRDETKLKLKITDLLDQTSCEIEVPSELPLSKGVEFILKEMAKLKTENLFKHFGKFK